jgi:hypothetical protein
MSIRAATEHDAVAISHVHVQSWRTTYAGIVPEEYLATLNEAERVLLWREWLTRDIRSISPIWTERLWVLLAEERFVSQSRHTMLSCMQSIC